MAISPLSDLARRRKMSLLLECELESEGKPLGKVTQLIKDKYDRVSGIEVKLSEGPGSLTIPYEWIDGVDEMKKVVFAHIPKK